MINRVLIANRSKIALRTIQTARDIDVKSIAVYSDSDRDAQFIRGVDEAHVLVGAAYADTYTNAEGLLGITRKTEADAAHPGYGFLSGVPEFAQTILEAGIAWIGPSPEVLDVLGNKVKARYLVEFVSVNPVAGLLDPVTGRDAVDAFVAENGFPIVTKKADGGGDRGTAATGSNPDFDVFFTAHGHHTEGSFVERFICTTRYVETQCARDSFDDLAIVST